MRKLFDQIPADAVSADFIEASENEAVLDGYVHAKTVPYCIVVIPVIGRYEVAVAGSTTDIDSGEALLTPSNIPLKFVHFGDPAKKFLMKMKWIHFHFTIFGAIDFTSLLEMPMKLDRAAASRFGGIIDELLRLQRGGPGIAGLAKRAELGYRALSLVCEVSRPKKDALYFLESSKRLKPVLDYMKRNLSVKTNVSGLAKVANLSPSRFHTVFREITGSGPMEYLRKLRVNAAFRLIMTSDDKLQHIAEKTGFCNEFHLSREFKAEHGRSPREYRKKDSRSFL